MRPRSLPVAAVVLLMGAIALPAQATHDPVQTLPVNGQASEVYVGIADDGTATAAWNDSGTVKTATRPAGGFFGVPQTLGSGPAGDISFDESSNGNAVVAWSGGMSDGLLLASTRIGGGAFAAPQVLVGLGGSVPSDLDVAISNAGRATVVWQENPLGADSMIRAAMSDSGGLFGSASTIHQAPNLQGPNVDMNDLGDAIAVWESVSVGSIQTAAAPAGGPFGSMNVLRTLEQGPGLPDVAVGGTGAAVVAWKNFTTPDPQCDTSRDCTPVPLLEAAYGNVGGSFGFAQSVTDPNQPTVLAEHETAVDDSGKAAILFTATLGNTSGVFGVVSDATGTFSSGPVTVSPFAAGGTNGFEIAAGSGEFTAVWANDHDQDGVGEAWQATSSGGSFGSPHQISPEDDSSVSMVHGARNNSGQTISGWVIDIDGQVPQVVPVADGIPPEFGSDSDDNLVGTEGDDVVHLLGGDDTYSGGDGNDSIFGEDGNDNLKGDGGSDLVDGGPGSDTANGGAGDDSLLGRGGSDRLKGSTGDDTLKGGGGNDVLDGGGFGAAISASGAALTHGGEVIIGGSGKDTCFKYSKQDVLKSCEIVKRKRAH